MLHWIRTRSRRDLILACGVAVACVMGAGMFLGLGLDRAKDSIRHEVRHQVEHRVERVRRVNDGGVAFDRSFDIGSEGRLEIHVGDFDVAVSNGSGEARVVLTIDDGDVSADDMEAMGFEVEASEGSLTIRTEDDNEWYSADSGDFDASLEVTVPSGFDVSVQTGDGDVAVGSFEGEVSVQTGDGDVAVGRAEGALLRVQTGDGDIAIASADGREVRLHTGDGDVAAASLSADEVTVRTGDGDIHIQDLAGQLEATTGDGDVQVRISRFEGVEIRSGDGDITLFVPSGISADVDLNGSDFVFSEAFELPLGRDMRSVEGQLNGGGAELSIRVGDGTIRINEN